MTMTAPQLLKTATGQRLHIAECPHILGAAVSPATFDEIATTDICTWCDAELNEVGRTEHDTIEAALLDMGAYRHQIPELTRLLATVERDKVFVPFSRSYVAVAREGRTVAVAGHTYVDFLDGRRVELPGFVSVAGEGGNPRRDVWGSTCPVSFVKHPVVGDCEWCL
jgi:hypothetical protein